MCIEQFMEGGEKWFKMKEEKNPHFTYHVAGPAIAVCWYCSLKIL